MRNESTAAEQYAELCDREDERLSRPETRKRAGREGYLNLLENLDRLDSPEWSDFATRALSDNEVVV